MSEEFAPALFVLGVLLIVGKSCEDEGSRTARRHEAVVAEAPAPRVWDEKSDCYPGAPPNSLASALDPLKAHCDRGKAVAKLATIAAVGLLARGGGAGMARAAVARTGSAGAASELGAAGSASARLGAAEMAVARGAVSYHINEGESAGADGEATQAQSVAVDGRDRDHDISAGAPNGDTDVGARQVEPPTEGSSEAELQDEGAYLSSEWSPYREGP